MDKSLRTPLRNTVTACRKLLEGAISERLEGQFGIFQNGKFEEVSRLGHLYAEDQDYRQQLLIYLEHIKAGGIKPKEAAEQLIREIAFTHLNRLCAYKLMEAHGLIRESVSRGTKSQGFFFYLADHPEDEVLANAVETEKAYRHFLRWLGSTLSEELGALFSPEDPADRLYPPQRVLDQVLELLNTEELKDIWTEDETIGWVYQYFTPKELRDKSHKDSRAPRNSYEMAFRNQFYTPRYVVEFLTDNTLGRTWYEMRQGKTKIAEQCRYLIRRKNPVFLKQGEEVLQPFLPSLQNIGDPDQAGEMWVYPNPELSNISDIFHYALTVGGYEYARQHLGVECGDLANERLRQYHETSKWQGTFEELRCCLFFEQRRYHHFGEGPQGDDLQAILGLYKSICECWDREVEIIPFRALKDPRDLKILDPACGSGHFLLYCFDLLMQIYAETWDECPEMLTNLRRDLTREEFLRQVPGMILRYNLHGIDIDLRATQIASLALWLRAQRAYQELGLKRDLRPRITRANIVCAEPMPGEEVLLEEFTQTLHPPLIGQLVKSIFSKMKLAGEAGSLLKIEEDLREAIQAARQQMDAQPKTEQLAFWPEAPKPRQLAFDLRGIEKSDAEFWRTVEERVLEALRSYAHQAANGQGYQRKLFVEDAARGFAFLDVCRRRYDVILMNPPFGEPSQISKSYVENNYGRSKGDVLANFVERTLQLSLPKGKVGAITNRTPFFLTTQTQYREKVLQKEGFIEVMADLGSGVLEAMVETAAYTFSPTKPANQEGLFVRCLMFADKRAKLLETIERLTHGVSTNNLFVINPDEFARIEGSPYCYWISSQTIRRVSTFPKLEGNFGTVRVGLQTGDDWRFLRNAWEIPGSLIGPEPRLTWNHEKIREYCLEEFGTNKKWAFYSKTDSALPWFSPLTLVVNWEVNGDELKHFTDGNEKLRSRPQNMDFYFDPGFSYMLRSTRIVPYIIPAGVIPTAGRSQVYPFLNKEYYLLGYCASLVSSAIARFSGENFGQPKFQASIIQNLPSPDINDELTIRLASLIENEFRTRKVVAMQYEPYQEFTLPGILSNDTSVDTNWSRYSLLGQELELAIAQSIGLDAAQLDELARDIRESLEMQYSPVEIENNEGEDEETGDLATVEFIEDTPKTRNEQILSYLVGILYGRWEIRLALNHELISSLPTAFVPLPVCPPASLVSTNGLPASTGKIVSEAWLRARPDTITLPELRGDLVVDKDGRLSPATIPDDEYPIHIAWDGILVDDPDHPKDIVTRSNEVLEVLLGVRAEAIEQEACQVLGVKSLREYFRKPGNGGFWMDHVKRYSKSRRKAPIYWLLQSNRKNYALWLYYHRLDKDLLFKALTQYIEPKIRLEEDRLKSLRSQRDQFGTGGKQAKDLDKDIERQEDLLVELEDFCDKLRRVADLGLEPDLNDGVVLNIAPLWELVPWCEAKKYWEELLLGKYEWSSIGKQLRAKGMVK